jgi:hypothetical protein
MHELDFRIFHTDRLQRVGVFEKLQGLVHMRCL